VQQRIRALSAEELQQVLSYEQAHASRLLVTRTMEARPQEPAAGAGPSSGSPGSVAPERAEGARAGGSQISPETAGPPQNPP
jgi:hypothetical protein